MRWVAFSLVAITSCGFDWSLADKTEAGAGGSAKGGGAGAGNGGGGTTGGTAGVPTTAGSPGTGGGLACGVAECLGQACDTDVTCGLDKAHCCLESVHSCATLTTATVNNSYCVPSNCYDGQQVRCGSSECSDTLCKPFGRTCCDPADPACKGEACCC